MIGTIASLHIHGAKSGDPMTTVDKLTLVAKKGIKEDLRYYDRKNKSTGFLNRNHVSIIECDQILDLMQDMEEKLTAKLPKLNPGIIRSNIEYNGTSNVFLIECKKHTICRIGATAIVQIYKPRTTCYQMDDIYQGLQDLTQNKKLGVIAEIIQSGEIRVGDPIVLI